MIDKGKFSILILDDEKDICLLVSDILKDEGYAVRCALKADQFFHELKTKRPHLVLLDICLNDPCVDGMQLLDEVKRSYSDIPVVIMSGHGTFKIAVSAIKKGAYDFIEKPFESGRLLLTVERALENYSLRLHNVFLSPMSSEESEILGSSKKVKEIRHAIKKISSTDMRVCITGESGVGKKLIAETIHKKSKNSSNVFFRLDCSCLKASSCISKELLGEEVHGKIVQRSPFESAASGTLLLENIDQLPMEGQCILTRLLESKKAVRVGGSRDFFFNPRVITTSKVPLDELVQQGVFLSDLFHRLSIISIHVTPIRDRIEDLDEVVRYFGGSVGKKRGLPMIFSQNAIDAMKAYLWPGNVREIFNMVERIAILFPEEEEVTVKMLPGDLKDTIPMVSSQANGVDLLALPLREARNLFEKRYLMAQISRFNGSISKAAEFVGMERTAFHRKLKLLNKKNFDEEDFENSVEETKNDCQKIHRKKRSDYKVKRWGLDL